MSKEFAGLPVNPDVQNLLTLKVLTESDADANNDGIFKNLQREQLQYLKAGIALCKNDAYLQYTLGTGDPLESGLKCAQLLKSNAEEKYFEGHINDALQAILSQKDGQLNSIHSDNGKGIVFNQGGILEFKNRDDKVIHLQDNNNNNKKKKLIISNNSD